MWKITQFTKIVGKNYDTYFDWIAKLTKEEILSLPKKENTKRICKSQNKSQCFFLWKITTLKTISAWIPNFKKSKRWSITYCGSLPFWLHQKVQQKIYIYYLNSNENIESIKWHRQAASLASQLMKTNSKYESQPLHHKLQIRKHETKNWYQNNGI